MNDTFIYIIILLLYNILLINTTIEWEFEGNHGFKLSFF